MASNRAKLSDTQIDTSCVKLCDQKSGRHTTQDPVFKLGSLAVFVAFAAFFQIFPFSTLKYDDFEVEQADGEVGKDENAKETHEHIPYIRDLENHWRPPRPLIHGLWLDE